MKCLTNKVMKFCLLSICWL